MIYALVCMLLSAIAFLKPTILSGPYAGPLVWAVLVLAVMHGAWRLARAACPAEGTAIIVLAAGLIAQVVASLVVTVLGFAEVLTLSTQLLAVGILSVAAARVRVQDKAMFADQRVTMRIPSDALFAGGMVVACVGVGVILLSQLRYAPMAGDVYHLQMVVEWIQRGSIWPVDYIQLSVRGFPGFRESILVFLSLPLHQVHLARLGVVEFPLFVLVVFVICRNAGSAIGLSMVAAAYAVTTPVVARATTLAKNDLSLVISFTLAMLFVSRMIEARTKARAILAGLALGALAGTKYTGALYAVVVVTFAMIQDIAASKRFIPAGGGPGRGTIWTLVFAAAFLVGGPWYLRNSLAFGNPLYPARVEIAGMTLFNGLDMRDLISNAKAVGWDVEALIRAWPLFIQAYGILIPLIAIGVLGLGWAMATGKRPLSRHVGILCLALACFVVFLHQPGTWLVSPVVQPDFNYNMRFLLPWFISSLVAGSVCLTGLKRAERLAAALFLVGAVLNLAVWARWWWVLLALVLVGVMGCWTARGRDSGRQLQLAIPIWRVLPFVVVVIMCGMAIGVNAFREYQQGQPSYGHPADNKGDFGTALAYAHRIFQGQKIVAYSYGQGPLGTILPLYGDDLSSRVVLVNEKFSLDRLLEECEIRKADYLVVFPRSSIADASEEDGIKITLGSTLMALHPDRFSLAFQSGEMYVLKVLQSHRKRS